jgi:hypothetical protein
MPAPAAPPKSAPEPWSDAERALPTVCAFCDDEAEAVLGDGSRVVCWRHFQLICDGERDRAIIEEILADV